MEKVTVEFDKDFFEALVLKNSLTLQDYNVKKVEVKDDFFKDDAIHWEMKKQSDSAYKRLKEYEFKTRNK